MFKERGMVFRVFGVVRFWRVVAGGKRFYVRLRVGFEVGEWLDGWGIFVFSVGFFFFF